MRNEIHFRLKELRRLVQCSLFSNTKAQKYLCLIEEGELGECVQTKLLMSYISLRAPWDRPFFWRQWLYRAFIKNGIDCVEHVFLWWKWIFRSERERTFAVGAQVFQALFRLRYRRDMSLRHPPDRRIRAIKALKPLPAHFHHLAMSGLVDIIGIRFQRRPAPHIEEYLLILIWAEARRIALVLFQTPDKARAIVGQRVDFIKFRHKTRYLRIIQWSQETTDVDLCQLIHMMSFHRHNHLIGTVYLAGAYLFKLMPIPWV